VTSNTDSEEEVQRTNRCSIKSLPKTPIFRINYISTLTKKTRNQHLVKQ
jgi:hypothetical protein